MTFLAWAFSPEGNDVTPYGQAIDSMPIVPGKSEDGLQSILPNVTGVPAIAYFEPVRIMQAARTGPFWKGRRQGYIFMPVATNDLYAAPPQPVRYDTYSQLVSSTGGQVVHGSAPTKGIYTGVEQDASCGVA